MSRSPVNHLPLLWALLALCFCGCGSKEETPENLDRPETLQEAIQEIISLYESGDFDSLIRTRYAEIGKTEGEAQIEKLVERFSTRFADKKAIEEAVSTYRAALKAEPETSQDGKLTTFKLDQGIMKLSRMPSGKWGFHL